MIEQELQQGLQYVSSHLELLHLGYWINTSRICDSSLNLQSILLGVDTKVEVGMERLVVCRY